MTAVAMHGNMHAPYNLGCKPIFGSQTCDVALERLQSYIVYCTASSMALIDPTSMVRMLVYNQYCPEVCMGHCGDVLAGTGGHPCDLYWHQANF